MGSLVLDLVEMTDLSNFNFMDEILHCASIVNEIRRPLMFSNGIDRFDPVHAQMFIRNRLNFKGDLSSRYLELAVIGEYDPAIDLLRSFDLTISDLNIDPDGSNASVVELPHCPLRPDGMKVPRCFVGIYYAEFLFESAIEFCLLYLKSRKDKNAVLWIGEVLPDDPFLNYSELSYLWKRFKGKEMEAHEWFIYGWPEILEMRAAQKSYE